MTEMAARADRLLWIKMRGTDNGIPTMEPNEVPAIPGTLQEALSRRLAATAEDVTLLLAQAAVSSVSMIPHFA